MKEENKYKSSNYDYIIIDEPLLIHIEVDYINDDIKCIYLRLSNRPRKIYKFSSWQHILLMLLVNQGNISDAFNDAKTIFVRKHYD